MSLSGGQNATVQSLLQTNCAKVWLGKGWLDRFSLNMLQVKTRMFQNLSTPYVMSDVYS